MESERLIFVEEFGGHLAMFRMYARAPHGHRALVCEKVERGAKFSALCALGLRGVFAPLLIAGAVDHVVFETYVECCLVPQLLPGARVLVDNIRFHDSLRARLLIETVGARVEHFPAYSPDFNPLEECISKLKTILRTHHPATPPALLHSFAFALEQISAADILGWFKPCGYRT
jgi:transposase